MRRGNYEFSKKLDLNKGDDSFKYNRISIANLFILESVYVNNLNAVVYYRVLNFFIKSLKIMLETL